VSERRYELDPIVMPGVNEALHYLAQKGALLGVASGNLETIGWIKIEAAGLCEWFRFGGFSDHFPVRSELIGSAANKARELAGKGAHICVVGDTPRDIEGPICLLLRGWRDDEAHEHKQSVAGLDSACNDDDVCRFSGGCATWWKADGANRSRSDTRGKRGSDGGRDRSCRTKRDRTKRDWPVADTGRAACGGRSDNARYAE
jgi:hypothetical protein